MTSNTTELLMNATSWGTQNTCKTDWQCRACSYANGYAATACSLCGNPKEQTHESYEDAPGALQSSFASSLNSSFSTMDESGRSTSTRKSQATLGGIQEEEQGDIYEGSGLASFLRGDHGPTAACDNTGPCLSFDGSDNPEGHVGGTIQAPPKANDSANGAMNASFSVESLNMSFANWSKSDLCAWTCPICTFLNENPLHLTCAVCNANRCASAEEERALQERLQNSVSRFDDSFVSRKQQESEQQAIKKERMSEIVKVQEEQLQFVQDEQAAKKANLLLEMNQSFSAFEQTQYDLDSADLTEEELMRMQYDYFARLEANDPAEHQKRRDVLEELGQSFSAFGLGDAEDEDEVALLQAAILQKYQQPKVDN